MEALKVALGGDSTVQLKGPMKVSQAVMIVTVDVIKESIP